MTPKKKSTGDQSEATVEVTPAAEWKKPTGLVLPLPSGNVLRARRASIQTFMAAGIIPNSLMGIVQQSLAKGKELNLDTIVDDPRKINEMLEMVDGVVCFCSVEPKIHEVPTLLDIAGKQIPNEDAKDPDLVYVDEVDDEDKMFIFQWATGGTDDVATFRKEAAVSLADFQRG